MGYRATWPDQRARIIFFFYLAGACRPSFPAVLVEIPAWGACAGLRRLACGRRRLVGTCVVRPTPHVRAPFAGRHEAYVAVYVAGAAVVNVEVCLHGVAHGCFWQAAARLLSSSAAQQQQQPAQGLWQVHTSPIVWL